MNAPLPHNKLQVRYRVLQPGETATVCVAGATAGDTVPERWQAIRRHRRLVGTLPPTPQIVRRCGWAEASAEICSG